MIILNRNLTTIDGEIKAGTDVSGVLNDAAIAELVELGWADQVSESNEQSEDEVFDLNSKTDGELRALAKEIGLNLHHNLGREKVIAALSEYLNKEDQVDEDDPVNLDELNDEQLFAFCVENEIEATGNESREELIAKIIEATKEEQGGDQ